MTLDQEENSLCINPMPQEILLDDHQDNYVNLLLVPPTRITEESPCMTIVVLITILSGFTILINEFVGKRFKKMLLAIGSTHNFPNH
jgi:hypothetical protein